MEELKSAVVKLLISKHDFMSDEAEELVEDSMNHNPDMWNDNAVAEDLANYLASDEDDD